ncbi:hypothetical protein Hanom_Chr01g00074191 [Helianthus anomalus]
MILMIPFYYMDRNGVDSGRVSGRRGFLHGMGFGSQRVLGRNGFRTVSTRSVST